MDTTESRFCCWFLQSSPFQLHLMFSPLLLLVQLLHVFPVIFVSASISATSSIFRTHSPSSASTSVSSRSSLLSTLRPSLRTTLWPAPCVTNQSLSTLENFNSIPEYDVIVVGGGLCGSTASFYMNQSGLKILLLEEKECVGGCIDSHQGPVHTSSF
jgi:hypothetical protein